MNNYRVIKEHGDKRIVLLEFKRAALLYDLKNKGYIITDSVQKKTPDQGHNLTDIGEDGNVDAVTRALDLAFANVMRWLAGYVKKELDEDTYGHDILIDTDSYFVMLDISKKIPGSQVGVLRTFIHEYMIAFAMAEYCLLAAPELYDIWSKKAEDLESSIKGSLAYRVGGRVIKQHPF